MPGSAFAASVVSSVSSFASNVMGGLTGFAGGVSKVTNPPPRPQPTVVPQVEVAAVVVILVPARALVQDVPARALAAVANRCKS